MLRINGFLLVLAFAAFTSCIKPYDPEIDASATTKYVVAGRVTSSGGLQTVEVSRTSSVTSPKYLPVEGCQVSVFDGTGREFILAPTTPGKYAEWIDPEYLQPGNSFFVRVLTPEGDFLESVPDRMPTGPVIDSLYYKILDQVSADPNKTGKFMQFYVDLEAGANDSRYYLWEIDETWQYRAPHPREYYYDGTHHQIIPPDTTNTTCWITQPFRNVFTVSTAGLAQNRYRQFPLHQIDGKTSRLGIRYSILVRQLAISENAYNYWEKLRVNSNEQGGLFERQPMAIRGNVVNRTNQGKEVLGFFFAAFESSERQFYQSVEGIPVAFGYPCYPESLGRFGWAEFSPDDYPVYYCFIEGRLRIIGLDCIDCRRQGGTTNKPDFW